jgi:hypothetical protein
VKHSASSRFWQCYEALPEDIRAVANKNFDLLKTNPRQPSLHFKKVGKLWSARVGSHHRALGIEVDDDFVWIWIGSHAEYDKLIA